MTTIFGAFGIAREALLAQQRGMSVASNNIANVNTPGYSRQRPIFETTAPTFAADGFPLGGGVHVERVERVVDAALDAQLLRERQTLAYLDAKTTGLERMEGILDELGGTGAAAALADLFRSLQDVAADPSDLTARETFVQHATTLVSQLRSNDQRLEQLQLDANAQVERVVAEINTIAEKIADLNRRIFAQETNDTEAAALRDERQRLLGELAEKIDFTSFERDDGQIAVFVAGGFFLVDAEAHAELVVRTRGGSTNPDFFEIYHDVSGSVAGPITGEVRGGELGALLELRDTIVPAYRERLDRFAFTLAAEMNAVHRAGYGLVDGTSRDLFTGVTTVEGAARALALNPEIAADPRHLAAAGALDGAAGAPGDNRNALALAALETTPVAIYRVGDALGAPTGETRTLPDFYAGISGSLGTEVAGARRARDAQEVVVEELEARRSAISGVSIDEEVAQLVRYERAYQASTRVLGALDELLRMLLEI